MADKKCKRCEELETAVANLHELLNLSPVAADYPTRLAALHSYRDRNAAPVHSLSQRDP